jgi:general secretion pathway protein G
MFLIKHKVNKKYFSGFTLIELLVVVSIIGILATLLVANYNATRQRARDAQRKSDLRNIQTALRTYYNDRGRYPSSGTGSSSGLILGCGSGSSVCDWGSSFSVTSPSNITYMNILPKDPSSDRRYYYTYDSSTGDYALSACLENKADDKCKKIGTTLVTCSWLTGIDGCVYEVKP